MSEPQLSIRSARARDLAHKLARQEGRTVSQVVVRALEAYDNKEADRESAAEFYTRLSRDYGNDLDLEAIIQEDRKPDHGPDL